MRKLLIGFAAVAAAAFLAGPSWAHHVGAGEHTYRASKNYRAKHKKKCAHWGAHHHHGIHLEGSH